MLKKSILAGIVAASFATGANAAVITLSWNFGAVSGTDINSPTSGIPTNFIVSGFSNGNSLGTVADPINATSPSSGYAGVSGVNNFGNAVKIGSLSIATSAYYSFTLDADAGYTVSLTDIDFGTRSTATGPVTFALYSSVDGFSTELTSVAVANNSTWTFKDTTMTSTPISADGGVVEYRLYTYGGTGSPGSGTENNRIDDVSMTVSVVAVPEPASATLLLGSVGTMFWFFRRRRVA